MGAERIRELLLDAAPRPKIAAGVLAYLALRVLSQLGIDVPAFLGLPVETVEALIVFAVMYVVRDRFAVPMSEAVAAKARAAAIQATAERWGIAAPADPPDLSPVLPAERPPDVDVVRQPSSPGP